MKSKVRRLEFADLEACLKLDELVLNGIWKRDQWSKELTDPSRVCLGISNSSKLIAIACSWVVLDEIQITAVAVHPNFQRLGHGRLLISKLLEQAKEKGAIKATLEVESKNIPARKFYKSCGFITQGERRNYYRNGSDALLQSLWIEEKDCKKN